MMEMVFRQSFSYSLTFFCLYFLDSKIYRFDCVFGLPPFEFVIRTLTGETGAPLVISWFCGETGGSPAVMSWFTGEGGGDGFSSVIVRFLLFLKVDKILLASQLV
jgi:hypothetical protein